MTDQVHIKTAHDKNLAKHQKQLKWGLIALPALIIALGIAVSVSQLNQDIRQYAKEADSSGGFFARSAAQKTIVKPVIQKVTTAQKPVEKKPEPAQPQTQFQKAAAAVGSWFQKATSTTPQPKPEPKPPTAQTQTPQQQKNETDKETAAAQRNKPKSTATSATSAPSPRSGLAALADQNAVHPTVIGGPYATTQPTPRVNIGTAYATTRPVPTPVTGPIQWWQRIFPTAKPSAAPVGSTEGNSFFSDAIELKGKIADLQAQLRRNGDDAGLQTLLSDATDQLNLLEDLEKQRIADDCSPGQIKVDGRCRAITAGALNGQSAADKSDVCVTGEVYVNGKCQKQMPVAQAQSMFGTWLNLFGVAPKPAPAATTTLPAAVGGGLGTAQQANSAVVTYAPQKSCPAGQVQGKNSNVCEQYSGTYGECPAGKFYDYSAAKCVTSTAKSAADCKPNENWFNGACVEDRSLLCPVGTQLNKQSGFCVGGSSQSAGAIVPQKSCPAGQVQGKNSNVCEQYSGTYGECPAGKFYDYSAAKCVTSTAKSAADCKPNENWFNGACWEDRSLVCPAGTQMNKQSGSCVGRAVGLAAGSSAPTCAPGYIATETGCQWIAGGESTGPSAITNTEAELKALLSSMNYKNSGESICTKNDRDGRCIARCVKSAGGSCGAEYDFVTGKVVPIPGTNLPSTAQSAELTNVQREAEIYAQLKLKEQLAAASKTTADLQAARAKADEASVRNGNDCMGVDRRGICSTRCIKGTARNCAVVYDLYYGKSSPGPVDDQSNAQSPPIEPILAEAEAYRQLINRESGTPTDLEAKRDGILAAKTINQTWNQYLAQGTTQATGQSGAQPVDSAEVQKERERLLALQEQVKQQQVNQLAALRAMANSGTDESQSVTRNQKSIKKAATVVNTTSGATETVTVQSPVGAVQSATLAVPVGSEVRATCAASRLTSRETGRTVTGTPNADGSSTIKVPNQQGTWILICN